MKPMIGIVGKCYCDEKAKNGFFVSETLRNAIVESGGNPFVILPPQLTEYCNTRPSELIGLTFEEKNMLIQQLSFCDGIILPSGSKMFEYDFFILEYAINHDIPILGICLGMQIMANYKRKISNLPINNSAICHYSLEDNYAHDIIIDKQSKLFSILKKEIVTVDSRHQYHAMESDIYKTVARSDDFFVEAIEYPENTFNIGVQWNPEIMYFYDKGARKLLKAFIDAARNYYNWKN